VRQARQRCWRYDRVLDIDVKGYFDSIDWKLMLKAVRRHTNCPWVLLYIERWLKAPVQMEDGSVVPRTAGSPQGGVVSPILANLFLHYAFDMWMARTFPHIPFERYADDAICHCKSADEAQALWSALADRFAACELVLHPAKTKIVTAASGALFDQLVGGAKQRQRGQFKLAHRSPRFEFASVNLSQTVKCCLSDSDRGPVPSTKHVTDVTQ